MRVVPPLLLILLALAWWPGLGGAFVFDDYANLHPLESLKERPSAYELAQYVLGGKAGSLGRPIAHLSFALQFDSWPDRPQDFLAVNLLIHLLNAALWYAVVLRLQRLRVLPESPWLPAAACAVWALLPIHGGAVLYVVQRMTLLATTFMLAGTLVYLAGRAAESWRAYGLMSAGVGIGLGLGVLAKESAAPFPLLLLALEATLLASLARPRGWGRWSVPFLWVPVALLAGYLVYALPTLLAGYEYRPFTLDERLLTQPRLLFLYLAKAFLPSAAGIRFHYDDVVLSTSLLQPWGTALALAGWTAIAATAVILRRRAPVLAFAVAWYLAGHALESSFIPLELAFDHRSYAPTLGPVLTLCVGGLWLAQRPQLQRLRAPMAALAFAYVAALGAGTWFSASLWGRPLEQAAFWSQRQPESRRAVYHHADQLLRQDRGAEAASLYRLGQARWPADAVLGLSLFNLGCDTPQPGMDGARVSVLLAGYDGNATVRVVGLIQQLALAAEQRRCAGHPDDEVLHVVNAALQSRWLASHRTALLHGGAQVLHASGRTGEALDWLERALAVEPQVPLLQLAVVWSLETGDGDRARRHLATAETDSRLTERTRWIYREEIRGLRQLMELYESLEREAPA